MDVFFGAVIIVDVKVDKSKEPIFPSEKYPYHWKGSHIILDDIEGNRDVQIKRIVHFFETIKVPRIREKTVEKLWENGMKTIKSITQASIEDFLQIKGMHGLTQFKHYIIHDIDNDINGANATAA